MKQTFNVTGMTCSACSAHVEKAVGKVAGVSSVAVSLLTNSMQVVYDESAVTPDTIIKAVVDSGYGASLPQRAGAKQAAAPKEDVMAEELKTMKRRIVTSFLFMIPLFYISMGHMMGPADGAARPREHADLRPGAAAAPAAHHVRQRQIL